MTKVIAPGIDRSISEPRPEPPKPKKGEKLCNCKKYPAWYCDVWPRCVGI